MKRKSIILITLIAMLACCAGTVPAWAYFTANTMAEGKLWIKPVDTEPHEQVINKEKHLTIYNRENGAPVYVRARGFSGDDADLSYAGSGWTDGGDGWWYYESILDSGETTTELVINIEKVIPEDAEVGDNFNIVVVYESTRVVYDENGPYADWDHILDSSEELYEGGN